MAVIETPTRHRYPWYVRLFFWNQKRRYGRVLDPTRLWGRSPKVFASLALLYGSFDRRSSPIDPVLRTLVTVRVSQINWCSFCIDINGSLALRRGLSEEKLLALEHFAEHPLFDARERAVLCYVEAVTYSDRQPTASHFAELRQHFDDDAIVELTGLIGFQNLSSKFNSTLAVEPQGFCRVPLKASESQEAD